jgi:Zn-dependent peptidase ImmA (M78 family)
MSRPVPYLSEEQIERDADELLGEYAKGRRAIIAAPIPIEDIVEKHLKLGIEFDDMHRLIGVPRDRPGGDADILGAILFEDRRIVIDESLDPEEYPAREGRYRFTLAHEAGGHWRLHRRVFATGSAQAISFGAMGPSFVCRSSQAKERVEWQADFYASCLLMPKNVVRRAWRERFGNDSPRRLQSKNRLALPAELGNEFVEAIERANRQWENAAVNDYVRPFAEQFLVSMAAMRIRLEKLGLLIRGSATQRTFALGS